MGISKDKKSSDNHQAMKFTQNLENSQQENQDLLFNQSQKVPNITTYRNSDN